MKLKINIPEKLYAKILEEYEKPQIVRNILYDAVANGTPIPDNATNGDVIKALFPCLENHEYEEPYTHGIALVGNSNSITWFANDWWNSSYKR